MPAAAGDMVTSRDPTTTFLSQRKGFSNSCRSVPPLPASVSSVSRDTLRIFAHTKRVGNYLVGCRKLGEGSFAKVREGLHIITGEKVAIKVIDKKKAKKDSYVTKNLRREGQIHQMIRHPNITQLLDILETENSYYLVMELCPGGNLMHRIYEKKRLEEQEARKYIRQLIQAVEHLHRFGVVHRDLKIENLLLDEDNNIKLIDFGLSNCAGILGYSDPFSTQCGSPAYAAPELLARNKYGPKVDVWSIGVNMYAMLTGALPFTVEPFSLRSLYQKMIDKEMNPLPNHLSAGAIHLLRCLLEPDPVKRPNIQQALQDRWLNENPFVNSVCDVSHSNRINLEDLSQSVLFHLTDKLGYKQSDVINVVLSNRASPILASYFLFNKKLERHLRGIQKQDMHIRCCQKNPLHHTEKKKVSSINSYEEKKLKESEKRVDCFQKPLGRKSEKSHLSYKHHSCLVDHAQNSRAQLKEKKLSKLVLPEKEDVATSLPLSSPDCSTFKTGYIRSSSLEYIEMHHPDPQSPHFLGSPETHQQWTTGTGNRTKDPPFILNVVRLSESTDRQEQSDQVPQHRGLSSPVMFLCKSSIERFLCSFSPSGNTSPAKATVHRSPLPSPSEEKKNPLTVEVVPSKELTSNKNIKVDLGSPTYVKSRGRFPMMGIEQMLRKRSQNVQISAEKTADLGIPPSQKASAEFKVISTNGALKNQF
ncbi:hormonally up-regulated neu tumor-associated kinase [Protopterus annectens]|uniref:hormonally up-regulated neu tumor-associated kinase n=1 Tax=Protopterus annectens TaxID=7888 RepID=UPI001CF96925|nr:hormonally up-regulated neu tumor-associated kinase [Protopterus annectens]